jgi:hypothetical protein
VGDEVSRGERGRALELDAARCIVPIIFEEGGVGVVGDEGSSRDGRFGVAEGDVGDVGRRCGDDGLATEGYNGGGLGLRAAAASGAGREEGSGDRVLCRGKSTEDRAGSRLTYTRGVSAERRRGEGPLISRELEGGG